MEELPVALTKRIVELEGSKLTEHQREVALDAYRMNPGSFERALASAEGAGNPAAYFVSAVVGIVRTEKQLAERSAPKAQRHDMDEPACGDCADTGFVILTRDIGPNALAGDAAPCHCDAGLQKQKRYGTVHYGRDDYERAVPESERISLQEYAQSEEGRADPSLETMRTLWRRRALLKGVEE